MKRLSSQEYWEKNIEGFSGFYEKCSREFIQASPMVAFIYKALIFPLEKKVMERRFEMVSAFITNNVRPGIHAADIGCGAGVYTQQMAARAGKVYAFDFANAAIELTKQRLGPDESKNVVFVQMDIMTQSIPTVDVAICIGVVPYIDRIDVFFDNVLPHTNLFLFNFLDKNSWMNNLRNRLRVLDVRGYSYYSQDEIRRKLEVRGFGILRLEKLGTGFMVHAKRMKAKI